MFYRYPKGIWGWPATALVLLAVVTPQAVAWLLDPTTHDVADAMAVSQLVVAPMCLAAAGLVYFHYRLRRWPVLGWIALCLTAYGADSVIIALIGSSSPGGFRRPGWLLLLDLTIAVAVAAIAWLSRCRPLRWDPLATGLLTGFGLALAHLELEANGPEIAHHVPMTIVGIVVVGLWGWAAVQLVRAATPLRRWMSERLAAGLVALAISRVVSVGQSESTLPDVAALATGALGAVLLLSATLAGLRYEIQQHEERLEILGLQIAAMEAHERDQRSRLHEITNTMAGIAGASSLIHRVSTLPAPRRHRLEEMLDHEAARLSRILAERSPIVEDRSPTERPADDAPPPQVVDLDALVQPLVCAQEAVGRQVVWQPSGLWATGDHDAIAEALNVLLDNSRKHAPGATTTVTATRVDDGVEITVADDGPGIPAELAERSFAWGERGPGSPGQGLGLHLARTRLHEIGGSLELVAGPGATFVVRLPAAPGHTVAADHGAARSDALEAS